MSNAIVVFHRLAAKDYRIAASWYAKRGVAPAQRFREAVRRIMERIAATPDQGVPFRGSYRWMRTPRFPYWIYYEVRDPTLIVILAVAHARRRPGYWLSRTQP